MNEGRRSMSQALQTPIELPPEAVELIQAGTPKPSARSRCLRSQPASVNLAIPDKPQTVGFELNGMAVKTAEAAEQTAKPPKAHAGTKVADEIPDPGRFVSASFRLPLEILNALVRVSAERKIRRQKPFTQQEIVAEALAQWLEKNGFPN